ncbi:MAG: TrkA family potassium uptake protein [Desulfobacterales bacterium]
MKKQFAVIGMGNFGYYLAIRLCEKGHEVLAIDRKPALIQDIRDYVSQAVVADATDIKALEALGIKEMDTVVVCIGNNLSDSILTTLNLNDLGVKHLLAKAISDSHARILKKIGAHEIVFPEKDQAVQLAERLHNPNLLDYLPSIQDYSIVRIPPPKSFVGKALRELNLINRFGVQIVAIRKKDSEDLNIIPTANYKVMEDDLMIILGPNEALNKLQNEEA